ncbi:uncharacterized protein [Aegilops tauschii subsp. strangulata]|uniref:uncharacterized protein isoform X3 n=1 Tax=Aegilops tauschii subsp. strangulata TaxID=200361 RepID=UPI00098ACD48|nr:uncharacterized protein LOC109781091 isoform X2 [Aegilops tauschii subsp. strangulata]
MDLQLLKGDLASYLETKGRLQSYKVIRFALETARSLKEKRFSYAPESGVRYDGVYRLRTVGGRLVFSMLSFGFTSCNVRKRRVTDSQFQDVIFSFRHLVLSASRKKIVPLSVCLQMQSSDYDFACNHSAVGRSAYRVPPRRLLPPPTWDLTARSPPDTPTTLEAEQTPLARGHGNRVQDGDGAKEDSQTSTDCIVAAVPMEWRCSNHSEMEIRSSEETPMHRRLKENHEDSHAYCSPDSSMASYDS